MASGLSMPVGFKNGTDGSLGVAINAMIAASRPHSFLGVDGAGRVGVVRTAGNPHCHIVLRGGAAGPNYSSAEVIKAIAALQKAHVNPGVMIDASHDNSGKDPMRQPAVLSDVGAQIRGGQQHIIGVMLESHLRAGRQELLDKATLTYGQSVTDGCIAFDSTCEVLEAFAADVRAGASLRATA
jgi:3-deoxy-7-phosphoheptulonate synthase